LIVGDPIGALARQGLGRSRVLSGDVSGARAAYTDLLKIWKDADPDLPAVQAAKAEYAKVQ
jgi:hypothetical protein